MNNEQGVLGETIFNVAISRGYLFRPKALGEKWPVSDFYVELIDFAKHYHFFVQVKSSARGLDADGNLPILIDKNKVERLSQYHAPTYVAGVDVVDERVFLMGINKPPHSSISKLPTTFELVDENLAVLFSEVEGFWDSSGIEAHKSTFDYKL